MKLTRKIILLIIASTFILATAVSADIKITSVTKTSPFMGKPAKTEETIAYWSDDAMYTRRGEKFGILYDGKTRKIYFLLKENEQYMEVDWNKIKARMDAMADFMKNMTWDLKNTGKQEKIGNYDTTVWKMEVKTPPYSTTEMTFNLCESIKMPKIYEQATEDMLQLQGFVTDKMKEEIKKMKGYTVKMVLKVKVPQGELESVTDVTKVEYKDLKKSLFEIPANYRKIDFDLQKLNQMQQ